jgi:hypothetical protein
VLEALYRAATDERVNVQAAALWLGYTVGKIPDRAEGDDMYAERLRNLEERLNGLLQKGVA